MSSGPLHVFRSKSPALAALTILKDRKARALQPELKWEAGMNEPYPKHSLKT